MALGSVHLCGEPERWDRNESGDECVLDPSKRPRGVDWVDSDSDERDARGVMNDDEGESERDGTRVTMLESRL